MAGLPILITTWLYFGIVLVGSVFVIFYLRLYIQFTKTCAEQMQNDVRQSSITVAIVLVNVIYVLVERTPLLLFGAGYVTFVPKVVFVRYIIIIEGLAYVAYLLLVYRAWILFYEVEWAVRHRALEWKQMINPNKHASFFLRSRRTWGNRTWVSRVFVIAYLVWYIPYLLIALPEKEFNLRTRGGIGITGPIYVISVTILWCKMSPLDDVWGMRHEIKRLIQGTLAVIALNVAAWVAFAAQPGDIAYLVQSLPILIFCFYQSDILTRNLMQHYESKQLHVKTDSPLSTPRDMELKNAKMEQSRIHLRTIIFHEKGFDYFMSYLFTEFSFENLLFLVEAMQYKHLIFLDFNDDFVGNTKYVDKRGSFLLHEIPETRARTRTIPDSLGVDSDDDGGHESPVEVSATPDEPEVSATSMMSGSFKKTRTESKTIQSGGIFQKIMRQLSPSANSDEDEPSMTPVDEMTAKSSSAESGGLDKAAEKKKKRNERKMRHHKRSDMARIPPQQMIGHWFVMPKKMPKSDVTWKKGSEWLDRAQGLFDKYMSEESQYAVNVSFDAHTFVEKELGNLRKWRDFNSDTALKKSFVEPKHVLDHHDEDRPVTPRVDGAVYFPDDTPNLRGFGSTLDLQNDNQSDEFQYIMTVEQFYQRCLCLFEFAIGDILTNLRDSLGRFRGSPEYEEFKALYFGEGFEVRHSVQDVGQLGSQLQLSPAARGAKSFNFS